MENKLAKVVSDEMKKKAISTTNEKELERLLENLADVIFMAKEKAKKVIEFLEYKGYSVNKYEEISNKIQAIFEEVWEDKSQSSNIPNKTQKEWDLSKGYGQ